MPHLDYAVHSGPLWRLTASVYIHVLSAGIDLVCLVIGIRWVAARARRCGFSGTHGNLEAFILWKRCLVKVQRCSSAPLMTLPVFCPCLETEPCDGYDWWNRDTHTHICTHTLPSLCTVMDMTGESSERCFLSPSLPSSQASVSQAEPGFTRLELDWIAD